MTAIEWADKTWNPITGCTKVSPGCKHCYAERVAKRFYGEDGFALKLHHDRLDAPLKWRKPQRIFVCSMSDIFHEQVQFEFLDRIFCTMARCHQHTFLLLTKRPLRMQEYMRARYRTKTIWADGAASYRSHPPDNVWLGVSCETRRYLARVNTLLRTPAAKRFISFEPLLGDMRRTTNSGYDVHDLLRGRGFAHDGIDWAIVGGESGNKARPMDIEWARFLRNACINTKTAFFFKQWGGLRPKSNGRELDGREWSQFPCCTFEEHQVRLEI